MLMIDVVVFSLLLKHNVPEPMHTTYLIQQIAEEEHVDPVLLTKIIIVESRGVSSAVNRRSKDYGIAQINLKSHPRITFNCAMNKYCGLKAGAAILYKTRRPCQYNVGRRALTGNRLRKCLQYENKLSKVK